MLTGVYKKKLKTHPNLKSKLRGKDKKFTQLNVLRLICLNRSKTLALRRRTTRRRNLPKMLCCCGVRWRLLGKRGRERWL